jgi:hypothetical protein
MADDIMRTRVIAFSIEAPALYPYAGPSSPKEQSHQQSQQPVITVTPVVPLSTTPHATATGATSDALPLPPPVPLHPHSATTPRLSPAIPSLHLNPNQPALQPTILCESPVPAFSLVVLPVDSESTVGLLRPATGAFKAQVPLASHHGSIWTGALKGFEVADTPALPLGLEAPPFAAGTAGAFNSSVVREITSAFAGALLDLHPPKTSSSPALPAAVPPALPAALPSPAKPLSSVPEDRRPAHPFSPELTQTQALSKEETASMRSRRALASNLQAIGVISPALPGATNTTPHLAAAVPSQLPPPAQFALNAVHPIFSATASTGAEPHSLTPDQTLALALRTVTAPPPPLTSARAPSHASAMLVIGGHDGCLDTQHIEWETGAASPRSARPRNRTAAAPAPAPSHASTLAPVASPAAASVAGSDKRRRVRRKKRLLAPSQNSASTWWYLGTLFLFVCEHLFLLAGALTSGASTHGGGGGGVTAFIGEHVLPVLLLAEFHVVQFWLAVSGCWFVISVVILHVRFNIGAALTRLAWQPLFWLLTLALKLIVFLLLFPILRILTSPLSSAEWLSYMTALEPDAANPLAWNWRRVLYGVIGLLTILCFIPHALRLRRVSGWLPAFATPLTNPIWQWWVADHTLLHFSPHHSLSKANVDIELLHSLWLITASVVSGCFADRPVVAASTYTAAAIGMTVTATVPCLPAAVVGAGRIARWRRFWDDFTQRIYAAVSCVLLFFSLSSLRLVVNGDSDAGSAAEAGSIGAGGSAVSHGVFWSIVVGVLVGVPFLLWLLNRCTGSCLQQCVRRCSCSGGCNCCLQRCVGGSSNNTVPIDLTINVQHPTAEAPRIGWRDCVPPSELAAAFRLH